MVDTHICEPAWLREGEELEDDPEQLLLLRSNRFILHFQLFVR